MTKWIAVNCSKCGNAVGEGQYCKEGNDTVLLSVKLYKYCLNIEPRLSEQPTFTDFFISDLINTAKVHATHRFIIQGQQSHTTYALVSKTFFLQLRVFINMNVTCSYGYLTGTLTLFTIMAM